MKKRYWLWMVLTLLLFAGCQSGPGEVGFILYQVLDSDGKLPKPELVLADTTGKELRRISLPETEATVMFGAPTRVSQRAWVFIPDGLPYLIDTEQGVALDLNLPEEARGQLSPNAAQFRLGGGGERWRLLGSARGDLVYLVNLITGQAHDLSIVDENAVFFFSGLFSPDEEYVMLGAGVNMWLIPTADPSKARRLGTGKSVFYSGFSSDGKRIVYNQRATSGQFEVVIEQLDGSASEVVVSDDQLVQATFVPGQRQLVLMRPDRLSLFSLDDKQERDLLSYSGAPRSPWFAPSGKKILFGSEADGTLAWHLIDLAADTTQSLDSLIDYQPYFWDRQQRWLTFSDNLSLGSGERHLVGLDLESGATHQMIALEENALLYTGPGDFSSDGRFALISGQAADKNWQLWLLRADGGEARRLAEASSIVNGAFSPDGHWIAVGAIERTGDRNEARLTLMATEGKETRELGQGFRPIWVRP